MKSQATRANRQEPGFAAAAFKRLSFDRFASDISLKSTDVNSHSTMSKRSGSPLSPDDLQLQDSNPAPFLFPLSAAAPSHLASTSTASHAQSNAYELPIPASVQAQVLAFAQQSNVSGDDVQVGSSKDLELEQYGQPAVDSTLEQQTEQQTEQANGSTADVEVTQGGKKKRKKAAAAAGPRTSRACCESLLPCCSSTLLPFHRYRAARSHLCSASLQWPVASKRCARRWVT